MKKILVLLAVLFSSISAQATEWCWVDTEVPNLNVYLDKDSVKFINPNEAVYAIRYNSTGKPQKVVYLKSNFQKQYIGVIASHDYDEAKYNPKIYLTYPHTYMKSINANSFLIYPHRYVNAISENEQYDSFKNVVTFVTAKEDEQNYILQVGEYLAKNWNPPISAHNTETTAFIEIGSDGSLINAKVINASDENVSRSILAAIENTVLYPEFSQSGKNSLKLMYTFKYGAFKKSVY